MHRVAYWPITDETRYNVKMVCRGVMLDVVWTQLDTYTFCSLNQNHHYKPLQPTPRPYTLDSFKKRKDLCKSTNFFIFNVVNFLYAYLKQLLSSLASKYRNYEVSLRYRDIMNHIVVFKVTSPTQRELNACLKARSYGIHGQPVADLWQRLFRIGS